MPVRPEGFGPLPTVDRNDELQRISFQRLGAIVPADRFILRDEPGSDKGVDRSLEILIAGGATNIRAQIQMKGSDSTKFNADGSFSFSVGTSNLNYLLNGTCPLYIVWIESKNELRYVWAREEALRLFHENPNWQDQQSVTLRFTNLLDVGAWEVIHATALREGRMLREVHDAITSTAPGDAIAATVSANSEVVTPEVAREDILRFGFDLASSGYAPRVIQLGSFLTTSQLEEARVQLVLGYAHFCIGDFFTCRGNLGKAQLCRESLSDSDSHILDHLTCTCKYHFGQISHDDFLKQRSTLEQPVSASLGAQFRFDRLRRQYLASRDGEERKSILEQLKGAYSELSHIKPDSAARLYIDLILLYSESVQFLTDLIDALALPKLRSAMGLGSPSSGFASTFSAMRDGMSDRARKLDQITRRATELNLPALIAESLVVQSLILSVMVYDATLLGRLFGNPLAPPAGDLCNKIKYDLNRAVDLYKFAGSYEGEVRAKLVLAQWLSFTHSHSEAHDLARQARAVAIAMGYQRQVVEAQQILDGTSQFQQLLSEVSSPSNADSRVAHATDAELRDMANALLPVMGIPHERLPAVERNLQVLRLIAREQKSWCSHLQVIENQRHYLSPTTCFATDSVWRVVCMLYRHSTKNGSADAAERIDWFKKIFCAVCSERKSME